MCGELKPLYPHLQYPLVVAENAQKFLAAFYSPMPLKIREKLPEQLILVNGTYTEQVILDSELDQGDFNAVTTDCMGVVVSEDTITLNASLTKVKVPAAGYVTLTRG
jgi:hypothetical protein